MSEWLIGVVGIISLGLLLEILIPEGQTSKYVKGAFSLLVIFVVISPLPKLLNGEYDFNFESEHVKICIVAPVPNVISAGNEHWHRPIDTGTKVGDYRIFSSTGFLNALRRDCVEKDK